MRDEGVCRAIVKLERRTDLLDAAGLHDDDPIGHRHRLNLVMRDIDHGRAQAPVQRLDFAAHLDPQLGVEVGKRFVEQEDLRISHDRATHRDPLTLTSGQCLRLALEQRHQTQDFRRLAYLPGFLFLRSPGKRQRERHVLLDGHMRIKRIILEHHGDVAALRREIIDHLFADGNLPAGDFLQAGDHPKQCRLATPRRSHKHDELTIAEIGVDTVNDFHAAVFLDDAVNGHTGHDCLLFLRAADMNAGCRERPFVDHQSSGTAGKGGIAGRDACIADRGRQLVSLGGDDHLERGFERDGQCR